MTTILLDALIPIFVGLLLGYLAGRLRLMESRDPENLIALVMDFAIPCALFYSLSQSTWAGLRDQFRSALVITAVFCALYAATFAWARLRFKMSVSDAAVLALTVGFPNSAAVAIPLLATAYGPESTVPAALSIVVGAVTISPLTVALLDADRQSGGKGISLRNVILDIPRAFKKPVVWVPILALLWAYFGLHLPSYLARTLQTMGNAATGAALVLTGLVVSSQRFRLTARVVWTALAIVLIQPVFALGLTTLLPMSRDQIRDITLISAVPGGFFGLVFGEAFDAVPEEASSGLILSYALSAITLALWMLLLARVG